MDHRQELGRLGEAAAADWYLVAGYEVASRRWRCAEGEIDLVLRAAGLVVFCEVKTRSTSAFGSPGESVTRAKQVRLRRLAARWLTEERGAGGSGSGSFVVGGSRDLRFDVAEVTVRGAARTLAGNTDALEVSVIEGAF